MAKSIRFIPTLSFLLTLLTAGTAMSAEQTRFDWSASDSAPQYYAMKIIFGTLYFRGGTGGTGVPGGGVISHGWGLMNSTHVSGEALKPLPDKLDITFFSYLEDQFYRGTFDLPYDTILKLFQEEEAKPKRKTMKGDELPNKYKIIVGVAPGGTVAAWIQSQGQKELFFGKAQKVEMDFTNASKIPMASREERTAYVKKVAERESTPDILATIRKNGVPFNKWADFRKTYNWTPAFAANTPPSKDKVGISFYGGEGEDFKFPLDKTFTSIGHRVPRKVDFNYPIIVSHTGNDYYVVKFDEAEIVDAFTRLSAKQLPLQLEFDPKFPKEQTQVRLHNGKEAIVLKKFTVTSK